MRYFHERIDLVFALPLSFVGSHVGCIKGDACFDLCDGGGEMFHRGEPVPAFVAGGIVFQRGMGRHGLGTGGLHDHLIGTSRSKEGKGGDEENESGFHSTGGWGGHAPREEPRG